MRCKRINSLTIKRNSTIKTDRAFVFSGLQSGPGPGGGDTSRDCLCVIEEHAHLTTRHREKNRPQTEDTVQFIS